MRVLGFMFCKPFRIGCSSGITDTSIHDKCIVRYISCQQHRTISPGFDLALPIEPDPLNVPIMSLCADSTGAPHIVRSQNLCSAPTGVLDPAIGRSPTVIWGTTLRRRRNRLTRGDVSPVSITTLHAHPVRLDGSFRDFSAARLLGYLVARIRACL